MDRSRHRSLPRRARCGSARHTLPTVIAALLGVLTTVTALEGQERPAQEHCVEAERFLADGLGMVTLAESDTIQDWRTQQRLAGCRITAAGITTVALEEEVGRFYEALAVAGWTRTPDPRDAPREGSLRFRHEGSDCLFNFYTAGHLRTEADLEVSSAVIPGHGESRYNMFVWCKPAMEAAPRDPSRS